VLFGVSIEAVSCEYQIETTNLQCYTDLNAFRHLGYCKLYLPADKFPVTVQGELRTFSEAFIFVNSSFQKIESGQE
jgi:hypothetical protein